MSTLSTEELEQVSKHLADLEAIKARAADLDRRIAALQGDEARARVHAIALEGVLKKVAPKLSIDEQLAVSIPLHSLLNILVGPHPRVAAVGKLTPRSLRVVRDEPPEAA